ncbi:MAG: hypothetical protein KatS3mg027_2046 [Bacteroidia bacterium]|nr:MAG: hypothetical protein KatS3mg027_2046 [Bacteroidia bacterium]
MKWNKKHILYFLFGYVIFQFLWWEILLVKLHHENIEKEKYLNALNIADSRRFQEIEQKLKKEQRMKIIMVVGEGTVFLILILFGFYKVMKAYENERLMNERQMHFLLSLPHELKTPLSVIQLNLQTIQQNSNLNDSYKQQLISVSLNEVKRLNTLIDHLLITNKISKDKYPLNLQLINLSLRLNEWIQPYLLQKYISTSIQSNIEIKGDEFLIKMMIDNLLSNAVKFSDKFVEVKLYQLHDKVILEILNDGELITNVDKDKIFELFYRRPVDEQKGIKGTGLGLYLVKQIAQLHRFSIKVYTQNNCNVFQVVF